MLPADPPLSIERIGCAICGSEDHFTILKANDYRFHVEGEFNVVQCPRCGLIYLNPRPVDIDKLYPQKYYIQNRFAGLASTLLAFVKVKRIMKLRRTGRILDVGCGDGGFLLYFKNRKWLVYGVDTSETACELARRRLEKIYECNLKGCHFPPRFFDIVTMNHVLEHMRDPNEELSEINRILKDDGFLLISVPDIDSLQFKLSRNYWLHLDLPRHLYHYSPHTIDLLLGKCGLMIVDMRRPLLDFPLDLVRSLGLMGRCLRFLSFFAIVLKIWPGFRGTMEITARKI